MKIAAFGEIVWDHIGGEWYIGGAPFNCAAHCAKMGASAILVSAVGDDGLGRKALASARGCGIAIDCVLVNRRLPTGTVEISIGENGSPDFTIQDNAAWDEIILSDETARRLGSGGLDAVCFGTLAQRSARNRKALRILVEGAAPRELFYDVNIRQRYYSTDWIEWSLGVCTIMKCNNDEAAFLARLLFGHDMEHEEFARSAAERYGIGTLCVTRGPDGAAVLHDGDYVSIPGVAVDVADTVGAGDAFSAAFLRSFLGGRDAAASARFAVRIGAFVASRSGAMPDYTDEIKGIVQTLAD